MTRMNASASTTGTRPSQGLSKRNAGIPNLCSPGLPGAGPALPPTARRLLEAASRLLVRSGYRSLSVEAIGREAGEHKSLINYYFGSKQGLLITLIDQLVSDTLWQAHRRLSVAAEEEDPSHLIAGTSEAMLEDPQSYRLFFDLLPRLLEDPVMRKRLAELYRAYRELNTRAMQPHRTDQAPELICDLATMSLALADGLAVQVLAEPESVDVSRVLAMWSRLVAFALATMPGADSGAGETGSATR